MFVVVDPDREDGFTCSGWDCGPVMEEIYNYTQGLVCNLYLTFPYKDQKDLIRVYI